MSIISNNKWVAYIYKYAYDSRHLGVEHQTQLVKEAINRHLDNSHLLKQEADALLMDIPNFCKGVPSEEPMMFQECNSPSNQEEVELWPSGGQKHSTHIVLGKDGVVTIRK